MPATQRKCIYGGLALDVDRHYIGSVTATTHQEKGIITLESNPSRGKVTLLYPFDLQCYPWKVLEYWGPSLKFQLVVLDFLFCVFWTESMNKYSKLRGTRCNFPPKNLAPFARSCLQVKYFSSSFCSYIILEQLLSYPSFPKNTYRYLCILCASMYQSNGQSLLLLWHNNKLVYPPELSRIAGLCTNSKKKNF